jgi:hypothetical protein
MHKLQVNLQTNEIKEIELTQSEINEVNTKLAESALLAEQKEIEKQEKESNKQSAMNKLSALGLTEAEIKAITGI